MMRSPLKSSFEKSSAEAVPEPSTWLGTLAGFSILGIGAAKRKMKRQIRCN
jgi:PEP-CTERM putative exosortase interaction domain